jgi:dienelactone hydrolase
MRKRTFVIAVLLALATLTAACPQSGQGGAGTASGQTGTVVSTPAAGNTAEAGANPARPVSTVLAPAPAGAKAVRIATNDGWQLAAWYWPPKNTKVKAPGIILLHQRGADKSSWGSIPAKLLAEDYAVLAIDLRGHGETLDPQGQSVPLAALKEADYLAMLNDVAAAREYLAAQPSVNGERMAIIGASIGANLAIMYASKDYRIRTVICLSPGLDYFGLKPADHLAAYGERALYLIASSGDKYSYDSCAQLAAQALADPVSFRKFTGKGHGTDLLASQDGLADTIVSGWLLNHVPPER